MTCVSCTILTSNFFFFFVRRGELLFAKEIILTAPPAVGPRGTITTTTPALDTSTSLHTVPNVYPTSGLSLSLSSRSCACVYPSLSLSRKIKYLCFCASDASVKNPRRHDGDGSCFFSVASFLFLGFNLF